MATEIAHWTKLGAALRDARTRHGWSQLELARRASVSRSWLARVEAGHRGAELEPLLRLLAALQLTWTLTASAQPGTQSPTPPQAAGREDPLLALAGDRAAAAHAAGVARRRAAWADLDGRTWADVDGTSWDELERAPEPTDVPAGPET